MPGSACVRTAIKEDAINPYMRREPFPVHCFRVLFRRHVKPFEISMRHRKCMFVSTIAMRSVAISSTRYCRRTSGLEWPIMFASLVNKRENSQAQYTLSKNIPTPPPPHTHTHTHSLTHSQTHTRARAHTPTTTTSQRRTR